MAKRKQARGEIGEQPYRRSAAEPSGQLRPQRGDPPVSLYN